ncbi:hypothetical protein MIR68_012397 [Amoeboaphelidium protococcarum]|nr:hypothetical protein MIR68_012397 [Amoeboaphelidium protococcarum]
MIKTLNQIPSHIIRPYYVTQPLRERTLNLKNATDIVKLRESCVIARDTLDHLKKFVVPGTSTFQIDAMAREYITRQNAYPSPLMYNKFPGSVCTSVNEVAVHGIPSEDIILQDGDVISIDVTVFKNGFHGDTCATFTVGKCSEDSKQFVQKSRMCTMDAIKNIEVNGPLNRIGLAIDRFCSANSVTSLQAFYGHGIGADFHELPYVSHFTDQDCNDVVREGMVFTVEPVITRSTSQDLEMWEDEWTIATADGQICAQTEHTVAITHNGVEILTL